MAKPAIHPKIRKCKHPEQIFVVDQMPTVDARNSFTMGSVFSILVGTYTSNRYVRLMSINIWRS